MSTEHKYRCPKCGNESNFDVDMDFIVSAENRLTENGLVFWTDDHPARCQKCGEDWVVADLEKAYNDARK